MKKRTFIAFLFVISAYCHGQHNKDKIFIANQDEFYFTKFYHEIGDSLIASNKLVFGYSNDSANTRRIYIVKDYSKNIYYLKYFHIFHLNEIIDSIIEFKTEEMNVYTSRKINNYIKNNKHTIKNIMTTNHSGNIVNGDKIYWNLTINSNEYNYTLRMVKYPFSNTINSSFYRQCIYRHRVRRFMKIIRFPFS